MAQRCLMASQKLVIISIGNGLLPVWHQAIAWIHVVDLLSTGHLNLYQNMTIFCQENILENVVYKMVTILFKTSVQIRYLPESSWRISPPRRQPAFPCGRSAPEVSVFQGHYHEFQQPWLPDSQHINSHPRTGSRKSTFFFVNTITADALAPFTM